ncbi:RNA polymerase sigma factor [Amaricoccus solimangrovi]|uniref:RNA polymerase sigma factor n=2 Tax=Amaricoccus solimangrovi TaxID=2589815 RepID=A0A501WSJ4_9RHOB|nr:RNA polymerase sigma factor [Amaricoccus solimangrovi]
MLRRVSPRLVGYAVALTHDPDLAGDLVQDAIVRAVESRNVPADERAFRAWITRILRNLWIDRCRARRRRADRAEAPAGEVADFPAGFRSEDLILNRIVVREAFGRLSASHREILALIDILGFSYGEAAELLGVRPGTVMSRVSRARRDLLRRLSDEGVVPFPAAARRMP